jgi:hypothetical protein
MVLIVVLLGLAGYFLFAGPGVEAPIADEAPVQPTTTPVVRTNEPDDVATTTDDDEDDDLIATSTASTTLDVSADLE